MDIKEAFRITTGREPGYETTYDTACRAMSEHYAAERAAQASAERLKPHLPQLNQRLCGQGYMHNLQTVEVALINARAVLRGSCTPEGAAADLREAVSALQGMIARLDAEGA